MNFRDSALTLNTVGSVEGFLYDEIRSITRRKTDATTRNAAAKEDSVFDVHDYISSAYGETVTLSFILHSETLSDCLPSHLRSTSRLLIIR